MQTRYEIPDFTFAYRKEQRECFQHGALVDSWRARYPQLFDTDDDHFARTQPENHFFEWLTAVLLYESTGYLSLQEYILRTHARKRAIFESIVKRKLFQNVDENQAGIPDLFVYSHLTRDWFFCEVKGGSDRIRPNQIERFAELEQLTGKKPKVVHLQCLVP